MNEDFGFGGTGQTVETVVDTEEKTDLETGEVGQEGKTNLDNNNTGEEKQVNTNTDDNKGSASTGGQEESVLNEGDSIELDGVTYTVNEAGDLVDEKGEVFKTKAELPKFLEEYTTEDSNEVPEIKVEDIQKLVGVDVVDEKGKAVKFDNTPQGVAEYVNSVLELKKAEFAQAGINKLIEDYPIVNDFLNYYIANGNSYEGFGELKDRSGIVIDENNEISSDQLDLLARVINGEARGEPYEGQVAVGAVILNRVDNPNFPNTIAGVVYQKGAFDSVADGQINMTPTATARKAAQGETSIRQKRRTTPMRS